MADAENAALDAAAERVDELFAHLWMVRKFLKDSPEGEDFPELLEMGRAIFDAARAIEASRSEPLAFLKATRKKMAKLAAAAAAFRGDAPRISDHTNFRMAVRSVDAALAALQETLAAHGC
jgi:aminodeoxyfutalosine deaminase